MKKKDYDNMQNLQENTIKKLIKYINEHFNNKKGENYLESIEFHYPDFDEKKANLAFNVWLSTDYRIDSGESFIDLMLKEKSDQLSKFEKNLLIERNKSFISLFEIEEIDGKHIHVKDILTSKKHLLCEPAIASILHTKDLIFGRIGKIMDHMCFIGNISFLPLGIKDEFLAKIFVDYNRTRFSYPHLTVDRYLKLYSLEVYRIYTECIYYSIDMEVDGNEDIASQLYDELDEFEYYLQTHLSKSEMKKHITNLINLFEHYLVEYEITLHDLDQRDIENLIDASVKTGLISTQQELSSYISTLKKYFGFLKNIDKNYKDTYNKVLEISKNRFLYISNAESFKVNFNINKNISNNISNEINENAFDFIMDYEKFLMYLMSNPLNLTKGRLKINRKTLIELNRIMSNEETITKKAPNQKDFVMLDFFYNFSLSSDFAKIDKYKLLITKKGEQFLRLPDEEKYTLLLQYLLGDEFLHSINKDIKIENIRNTRKNLIEKLSNFKEEVYHKYNKLDYKNAGYLGYTINLMIYMKLMGLAEYSYYPNLTFKVTSLGKQIFKLLLNRTKSNISGKVIYINELR